jgi:hypothetical protein
MPGRGADFLTMSALAVAGGLAWPASGLALDCTKPRKELDAAICKHADLQALDAQVEGLWFAYNHFPFLMGASGARSDEEKEFQEKRAACGGNAACLRRVYRARINGLKVSIAEAMDNIRREEDAGPPTFPSVLPMRVEGIVAGYADQCRVLGGTLTGATRPNMLAGDLDGDGKADYVLNPQNLKCSVAATAFCGNGGCQISIAVSSNGYKDPITVLGGQPTLTQTSEGTRVEVWVHRSNCSITNAEQACWQTFAWKDGRLEEGLRVRPRAD